MVFLAELFVIISGLCGAHAGTKFGALLSRHQLANEDLRLRLNGLWSGRLIGRQRGIGN